ncbi:MAG: nucleoside triphosphate pyrophosphohydrolase [Anaerolineaceae bacterium]|nr:nucleoside triphosphate pyrophosphohydrolase [Anaerolineaceae bacterium]
MEKHYNKLIRDRIPEIIEATGKEYTVRTLDEEEYLKALQEKLQEELNEYFESNEVEELADILEIIHAILDYQGMRFEELEEMRVKKQEKRGGFKERLFLIKVRG